MELTSSRPVVSTQPAVKPTRQWRHILGPDWKEAYLFLLPAALLLGTIVAYPFLRALYIGFTRTTSLDIGPWVGLLNYQNLYKDPFFWDSVRISLTYTISAVVLKFFAMLAHCTINCFFRKRLHVLCKNFYILTQYHRSTRDLHTQRRLICKRT